MAALGADLGPHGFESTYFLLVQVGDPLGELANGLLTAHTEHTARAGDGLAYATVARSPATVMAMLQRRRAQEAMRASGGEAIGDEWLRNTCFLVPLLKRSDQAFLERITIGRSRNHDVVLRHRSVSKFHAWLECTADGMMRIGDAESRNQTQVDGMRVLEPRGVEPGQVIRFGSVEAMICSPEAVCAAIRGSR